MSAFFTNGVGPVFLIPVVLFFAIFYGLYALLIWRGIKSGTSWSRTTGRITTFGVSDGVPDVSYEYKVGDRSLPGDSFVPGVSAGKSRGTKLRKTIYLHPGGSLKFPPGAEVPVFYDPQNPVDSALVAGIPPGLWKSVLVLVLVSMAALSFLDKRVSSHWEAFPVAAFVLAAFWIFGWGIKCLRRHLRSRDFPSVGGKLLKAEIVYSSDSDSGGFAPAVEFEYEVEGARYRSTQLTAISARAYKSRQDDVQPFIDELRAHPEVTVHYDPKAPWDGFLQRGPVWGVIMPLAMGLVFGIGGCGLVIYLMRR